MAEVVIPVTGQMRAYRSFEEKADIVDRTTVGRVQTSEPTNSVRPGELVITVRSPVGAVAIASSDACLGRGVCGLRPLTEMWLLYYALDLVEEGGSMLDSGAHVPQQVQGNWPRSQSLFRATEPSSKPSPPPSPTWPPKSPRWSAASPRHTALTQAIMQQLLTGSLRLPIPDAVAENGLNQ